MFSAWSELIPIDIALITNAAIGALEMLEARLAYALSPCHEEFTKHDFKVRLPPIRA